MPDVTPKSISENHKPAQHCDRRQFIGSTAGLLGSGLVSGGSYFVNPVRAAEGKPRHKVERLGVGGIGLRYQGTVITLKAQTHGDVVAVCAVNSHIAYQGKSSFGSTPEAYQDYRELLDRKDVDVVMIGTPDHWHTKMVIDACRAGKDAYVEKPLTLTVDEGKLLRQVVKETGRVVQVGSWQRSDERFRLAIEMVRQGRIGKLQRVDVVLGPNKTGGPVPVRRVPACLDWNMWQGQTPDVPYIEERCLFTFRWWYEYSGGQMTDWGAHHLDIAQWGINSLPVEISGTATYPDIKYGFNVATHYSADYTYANGVVMTVRESGRNGMMFTGDKGRIFVNRGTVSGKPVEDLASNPLPREEFQVYDFDNLARPPRAGKMDAIINHMGNFFDCIETRKTPISDVESQHLSVSTCHLGNISMHLGRPLKWNPEKEEFIDDPEANAMLRREQRAGYEIA